MAPAFGSQMLVIKLILFTPGGLLSCFVVAHQHLVLLVVSRNIAGVSLGASHLALCRLAALPYSVRITHDAAG